MTKHNVCLNEQGNTTIHQQDSHTIGPAPACHRPLKTERQFWVQSDSGITCENCLKLCTP